MLEKKNLKEKILKEKLILPKERVLAGFSGGSDSVALCHLLAELRRELDFSLELIYIQHNLRGEESRREEEFVRAWAAKQNCPLTTVSVNVRQEAADKKLSIETAARELRHRAIAEKAEEGFDKIALAHHAKDQAETVLMNFFRGSGVAGLAGMRARRGKRIRPLLSYSKQEIMDYLAREGLDWCEDSSNDSLDYRRNRVRREIIPYLQEAFNPGIVGTLANNAEQMQELQDYLEMEAEKLFAAAARQTEQGLCLKIAVFRETATFMQRMLLRKAIEQVKGNLINVEQSHIARLLSLVDKESGKCEDIVEGWMARRDYEDLIFGRKSSFQEEKPALSDGEIFRYRLDIFRQNRYIKVIGDFILISKILPVKMEKRNQKNATQYLDLRQLPKDLAFRYAMPEDYIIINQQGNRKKWKDYLADEKVPRKKRAYIPVLASGGEIIWAVGYRIGYPYRITEKSNQILQITILGRTVKCQRLKKEFQEKQ